MCLSLKFHKTKGTHKKHPIFHSNGSFQKNDVIKELWNSQFNMEWTVQKFYNTLHTLSNKCSVSYGWDQNDDNSPH